MSIDLQRKNLKEEIFQVSEDNFEVLALEMFNFQAENNPLYSDYISYLNIDTSKVNALSEIPFLPISFFKTHEIQTGNWEPEVTFSSSGTTGNQTSLHHARDLNFYLKNTVLGFEHFYKNLETYCILALLPSYLERKGSSLISMCQHFIDLSKYSESGFFLNNIEQLIQTLKKCKTAGTPTLLIGVSFALLDLAEQYDLDLNGIIVMETGGMKGRRKEITRKEMHDLLEEKFKLSSVHSEYGMTELFSQAYSKGNGLFFPAPTMKVLTREINDPLSLQKFGKTGLINIVDLANMDTCSFIATDDLGKVYENGSFEILGRLDSSDIRGCNLLLIENT